MSLEQQISKNLSLTRDRIAAAADRADRDPASITLVAVTKSVGLEEIGILRDLGVSHFGENRVDIAQQKVAAIRDDSLTWHMIGNIQRRKVKEVIEVFDTIDAVDRLSLADALQRRCMETGKLCRLLLEVNISGEAQKHGFSPDFLPDALRQIRALDCLQVDGLMTMAPYGLDRKPLLALFSTLSQMAADEGLRVVSMGMSGDMEEAVEAGATQVRVGRALFDS